MPCQHGVTAVRERARPEKVRAMNDDHFDDEDDKPIPFLATERKEAERWPVAERVQLGEAEGGHGNGGIVPFPQHLRGTAAILGALTGKDRATVDWRAAHGFKPTAYEVRDVVGRLLHVTIRWDHATEPKVILPLRYCGKNKDGQDVFWFAWIPGSKPLFGGDRLVQHADAPVLVVEGEKTAEAAGLLFPNYVSVTWLSGAPAAWQADVSILSGRTVVVWPDNDAAGRRAARVIAARCLDAGASSASIVDVPPEFPVKWDVANAPPDGVTPDELQHLLATARPLSAKDAEAILRNPERRAASRRLLGHAPGYSRVDPQAAADALAVLDPDMGAVEWRRVARCWYHAFGQAGLTAFDSWSSGGQKYKAGEPDAMWRAFVEEQALRGMPLAWLLRQARKEAENAQGNFKVDAEAMIMAEIDALNENHAVVSRSGKTAVLRETYDPRFERFAVEYLKKGDFIDKHVRSVQLPTEDGKASKSAPLGKLWFGTAWRREYDGVVFMPGGDSGSRKLNLWRGFAVEPVDRPEGWSRLKQHLMNNVAHGDSVAFTYILDWLAHAVQQLGKPNGAALVLVGPKGAGKSILIQLFGYIFGQHAFVTSISEDIVGKFNAHLEYTLVLGVEEAFAPQNRAADGTLKDLITRETLRLEDKFFSTWTGKNHLRIIMTSNNDHVVRADGNDRRYAVFDVATPFGADPDARRAYFGAMVEQMECGGFEAMLGELLARDISTWNPEAIPDTPALRKQKLLNLANDPVSSWLHERLADGIFIVSSEHDLLGTAYRWSGTKPTAVPVTAAKEDFLRYCQRNGYRGTERMLQMKLASFMPPGFKSRVERAPAGDSVGGVQRVYDFPPINEARAAFTKKTGHAFEPDMEEG